jgi:hypothetical protein
MEGLTSWPVMLALAGAALALPGLRGLLDIRDALRDGELHRLAAPRQWPATRAFIGMPAEMHGKLATTSNVPVT